MKPESHRALMELISYGVEELSSEDAAHLMSRIHECHECTGQWVIFQKTYTVLSQSGQNEVSVERSQQMWLTCLEHAQHKPHATLASPPAHAPQSEVVPVSFRSDSNLSSQREDDRRIPSAPFAPFAFLNRNAAPRWTYALAAGAFALLATAYFAAPDSASLPVVPNRAAPRIAALPIAAQIPLPGAPLAPPQIAFSAPPRATTGMIDYHSVMGFEPFSDHLAPTLTATLVSQP